jgi:hypothetical protein
MEVRQLGGDSLRQANDRVPTIGLELDLHRASARRKEVAGSVKNGKTLFDSVSTLISRWTTLVSLCWSGNSSSFQILFGHELETLEAVIPEPVEK